MAQPHKPLPSLASRKTNPPSGKQLAAIPQEEFEAALAAPEKPSTTGYRRDSDVTPRNISHP
jgi:hypothetical protein